MGTSVQYKPALFAAGQLQAAARAGVVLQQQVQPAAASQPVLQAITMAQSEMWGSWIFVVCIKCPP
jgi:hypothetical protein